MKTQIVGYRLCVPGLELATVGGRKARQLAGEERVRILRNGQL